MDGVLVLLEGLLFFLVGSASPTPPEPALAAEHDVDVDEEEEVVVDVVIAGTGFFSILLLLSESVNSYPVQKYRSRTNCIYALQI